MNWPRARVVVTVVAALAFGSLASCGLPHDGAARSIDPHDVPYGLLESDPPALVTPELKRSSQESATQLYLLGPHDQLVGVPATLDDLGGSPSAQLALLLSRLSQGPTDQQRAEGLGTALSPGVSIELRDLTDSVAQVQVQAGLKDPTADRLPLAIGQLVLSATSVRGVEAVQLVRDGAPVEVPLPGGALTSAPLTRADYAPLLTP
jgi:spore germination protein GerM